MGIPQWAFHVAQSQIGLVGWSVRQLEGGSGNIKVCPGRHRASCHKPAVNQRENIH